MALAHTMTNTEKVYPCIRCGSQSANIIRESPTLETTRVKCNACGMMYNASDSKELEEKGQIPNEGEYVPGPVQSGDLRGGDGVEDDDGPINDGLSRSDAPSQQQGSVPTSPSFVFFSKDRERFEFCTKRDFKKVALAWESNGEKYKVYELHPKKVSAKIEVQ